MLGYPISDGRSAIIGAVAVAVDLLDYDSVHYKSALANAQLPPGSVVTIVDSTANIIARWPDAPKWVGARASDVEIIRHIQAGPAGSSVQAHGMDGVEKLYGFTRIADTNWFLYAGVPTDSLVAPSIALMMRNALLVVVMALTATALAIYLSGLIRGPIRRLSTAVTAATGGRLEVRVPLRGPRELMEVGKRFNDMLAARAYAEEALAQEKERVEVTLASLLQPQVRGHDTLARLGGDEFGVLLENWTNIFWSS